MLINVIGNKIRKNGETTTKIHNSIHYIFNNNNTQRKKYLGLTHAQRSTKIITTGDLKLFYIQ